MEWVEITVDSTFANLPTDVKTKYAVWLNANPDKADRLAEITGNTVKEFRYAIQSAYANLLDPRPSYLPRSAVRHCENIIVFTLVMEMGLEISTAANSARTTADVFLRGIPYHRFKFTSDEAEQPRPRWMVPVRSPVGRSLPALLGLLPFMGGAP